MIWDIYYHFRLNKKSLSLLHSQAAKLISMASSVADWHATPYGRTLRFCDASTFAQVRMLWNSYCMPNSTQEKEAAYRRIEESLQHARNVKVHHMGIGNHYVFTGIRSAAPLGSSYAKTAHESYEHYWKHGSTSQDDVMLAETTFPNPLFASHDAHASTLHYGTDPLLGFHLATAFAPLRKDSAFLSELPNSPPLSKVVEASQIQFRAWCMALRQRSPPTLTIRYFSGDAIAFSYALHQLRTYGSRPFQNLCRDVYHLEPLELISIDYTPARNAPESFTVIDTSNLIDHLGALNLLTATSPLLKNSMSSVLYTESLVKREDNYQAYIASILCGDFTTVSLLLGLIAVGNWTNSSSSSPADEAMMNAVMNLSGSSQGGQMHVNLTWKRPSGIQYAKKNAIEPRMRYDETGLAHVLHAVYRGMFEHENWASLFADLSVLKMRKRDFLHYHRGSFAFFLRLVRSRVAADWHKMMDRLLNLIETDSTISMGLNYIQELYLYLHTLDLFSVDIFKRKDLVKTQQHGFGGWTDVPGLVSITLKVPRSALEHLTGPKVAEIGTPIAHYLVQSSSKTEVGRWQNIFSAIQVTFGEITTTGTRDRNEFAIRVIEDGLRWRGNSPLVVSFQAPSWFLRLEPKTAIVALGIQSTPNNANNFMKTLGIEMNIYKTVLGNKKSVYITVDPPNRIKPSSLHKVHNDESGILQLPEQDTHISMTTNILHPKAQIVSFTGRADLFSCSLKELLKSGVPVKLTQTAPCELTITFSDKDSNIVLQYPLPIQGNGTKTRIARKSSYIEVDAMIHTSAWTSFPTVFSSRSWNTAMTTRVSDFHCVDLRTLPGLDMTRCSELQWLNAHVAGMFSQHERKSRERARQGASSIKPDVRVRFKDSLFSLFIHFAGLQGKQATIFGLDDRKGGGIHMLIFVACMKLDIGNQTVVLDAAVLPLTPSLIPRISPFLMAVTKRGLCSIQVDGEELDLWRQVLPSFAERCREWRHRSSCTYAEMTRQKEDANDVFCACGRGSLPEKFIDGVPHWSDMAQYTTRVAISPIFSMPLVDPLFDGTT